GFPADKRNPNAAQLRVSQSGFTKITANPGAIVDGLTGGGGSGTIEFPVPANCGGQTPVCCPGGSPKPNCGPIDIDITTHADDNGDRLELKPIENGHELDVTLRARVKTATPLPVKVPIVGDCELSIDTLPGPEKDIQIDIPITFA